MVTSALIIKCTQEKMRLQAFPLSKTISRNTESVSELLHMPKQSKEVRCQKCENYTIVCAGIGIGLLRVL